MKLSNPRSAYNQHIDSLPGESKPHQFTASHLGHHDIKQAHTLLKSSGYPVSISHIARAVSCTGYTARGFMRNKYYIAACCISRHGPVYNHISALGVLARYANKPQNNTADWLSNLIYHAACELPELPIRVYVPTGVQSTVVSAVKQLGLIQVEEHYWYGKQLFSSCFTNSNPSGVTITAGTRAPRSVDGQGRPDTGNPETPFGEGILV